MTILLQQAFQAAQSLPEPLQDEIAASILAEIEDEIRWSESFARSADKLAAMAREAIEEDRAGKTLPLDPDTM